MRFPAVVTLPSLHVLCMSTGFNEFYRSLCQDAIPETLKGRDLYERYKRFHGAGSFKKLMTETAFGIENKRVGGLIKIPTAGSGRVRYKLDKAKILEHLDSLAGRPHPHEPAPKRAKPLPPVEPLDLEAARLTRAAAEFAGSTGLQRLILEPGLHSILKEAFPSADDRADYIGRLSAYTEPIPAQIVPPLENAGVYVLRLEGLSYSVYVGSSRNIPQRVEQHKEGEGAACTKDAASIELLATIPCYTLDELDDMERRETLDQMHRLGIDKVRGWKFSTRIMFDEHWRQAFEDICCRKSLCLRCGRASHFVTNCYARTKAEWCGGGDI